MALYEKKWWKDLFQKEEKKKVDSTKDIQAVIDFVNEIETNKKLLLPKLKKLAELEKESHVAKSGIIQVNLQTQAKILEDVLSVYESLQNDTDINGLRVKEVAGEFLKKSQRAGLKDLVKEKKQDIKWQFKW
tara:strand:- start:7 stop:402 length:396 start_codon:yes stop_codon:yes gene_type:complete